MHFIKSEVVQEAPSAEAAASASADLNDFAWAFYAQGGRAGANFVYSPYSISVATAMLSAGAAGETLAQIQGALHFTNTGDALHAGQASLARELSTRNREGTDERKAQTLRVSNDLWMAPSLNPEGAFLDPLARYYDSGVFLAPFETQPEVVRDAINDKVTEDTSGLIQELLPARSITDDTVFVLTNALYFNGHWSRAFRREATAPATFTGLDGTVGRVDMMHQMSDYPYVSAPGYQAVSLPYDGHELEMVFIVPDEGNFANLVASLDAQFVSEVVQSLEPRYLDLGLPAFEVKSDVALEEELIQAGMTNAFTQAAEFPAIGDVLIDKAFHQATLVVDEEGTEAAAATAFVGVPKSGPSSEPLALRLDRPFVFFVRDVTSNASLFVGHYVAAE